MASVWVSGAPAPSEPSCPQASFPAPPMMPNRHAYGLGGSEHCQPVPLRPHVGHTDTRDTENSVLPPSLCPCASCLGECPFPRSSFTTWPLLGTQVSAPVAFQTHPGSCSHLPHPPSVPSQCLLPFMAINAICNYLGGRGVGGWVSVSWFTVCLQGSRGLCLP